MDRPSPLMMMFSTTNVPEVWMGKKKARSKAKGKAAAKNKQEQKSKAKGGKGAR